MLTQGQQILFDTERCLPIFYSGSNHYGLFISGNPRKGSKGRSWTWGGSYPHNTRMHHYASLTSSQKLAWDTVAAAMDNDHSPHGVTTYTGPIAYMQTNLYLRLQSMPYTDTAPIPIAAPGSTVVSIQTLGPRFNPILLGWT